MIANSSLDSKLPFGIYIVKATSNHLLKEQSICHDHFKLNSQPAMNAYPMQPAYYQPPQPGYTYPPPQPNYNAPQPGYAYPPQPAYGYPQAQPPFSPNVYPTGQPYPYPNQQAFQGNPSVPYIINQS